MLWVPPAPRLHEVSTLSVREPTRPSTPEDRKRAVDPAAAVAIEKKIDPASVAAMLKRWEEEDARDPEPPESWEDFKRALDANRHSTRKLFP